MYKVGRKTPRILQAGSLVRNGFSPRDEASQSGSSSNSSLSSEATSPNSLNTQEIFLPRTRYSKRKNNASSTCSTTSNSLPGSPKSPMLEQQMNALYSSWKRFIETPSGEPDQKVVVYRPTTDCARPDFKPFDIDSFLMERMLKELEIDPKILNL
ncbi:unnamed protein product, partial [Mesorhabditis belari]|uniref:Uncharacterized protein n=1 Tax=Mesorhabditis belari TaxID=2138241 RepID=A0AAF3FTI2_9BILA